MRVFIAGIMQGSKQTTDMHAQDYRAVLTRAINEFLPDGEVYDPLADHGQSLNYDDDRAREVFLNHNRMCREVDLMFAYVPEASMGTAIEMWEAYNNDTLVVAISPLVTNWAVKFTSHRVYASLDDLIDALRRREIHQLIEDYFG